MNNSREKFELKISMEYEQPPCLARDGEGYDDSYVDNAWWGWQAATEQSQKEIAEKDELLDEQKCAIKGLNMCIGGEDSLTTNNLRACGEYLDNEKCLLEMVRELQAREKALVEALESAMKGNS